MNAEEKAERDRVLVEKAEVFYARVVNRDRICVALDVLRGVLVGKEDGVDEAKCAEVVRLLDELYEETGGILDSFVCDLEVN